MGFGAEWRSHEWLEEGAREFLNGSICKIRIRKGG